MAQGRGGRVSEGRARLDRTVRVSERVGEPRRREAGGRERVSPRAQVVVEGGIPEGLPKVAHQGHAPGANVGVHGRVPEGPVHRPEAGGGPPLQPLPGEARGVVKHLAHAGGPPHVEVPQGLVECASVLEHVIEVGAAARVPVGQGHVEGDPVQEDIREGRDAPHAPVPDDRAVRLRRHRAGAVGDVVCHRVPEVRVPGGAGAEARLRLNGPEAQREKPSQEDNPPEDERKCRADDSHGLHSPWEGGQDGQAQAAATTSQLRALLALICV
jgi:hypothetical protein